MYKLSHKVEFNTEKGKEIFYDIRKKAFYVETPIGVDMDNKFEFFFCTGKSLKDETTIEYLRARMIKYNYTMEEAIEMINEPFDLFIIEAKLLSKICDCEITLNLKNVYWHEGQQYNIVKTVTI
jgi:hypothetical protein